MRHLFSRSFLIKSLTASAATFILLSSSFAQTQYDEASYQDIKQLLDMWNGEQDILDQAKQELDALIARSPNYPPAYKELARYHLKDGTIRGTQGPIEPASLMAAEAALDKAILIDPDYADGYVLFGHLYRLMEQPEKGLEALRKADEIGTDNAWLYLNWADIYTDAGDTRAAMDKYRLVLELETAEINQLHTAYAGIIKYYKSVQNYTEVNKLYKQQIALDPTDAWPKGNYASFLLLYEGEYEASIAYATEAIQLMNYRHARYTLAAALFMKWAVITERENNPDSGMEYLLAAQELHPDLGQIVGEASRYPAIRIIATEANKYLVEKPSS
jgi:tetratricopeptide (TPR) repeat protein